MKKIFQLLLASLFLAGTGVQAQEVVKKIVFFQQGTKAANRTAVIQKLGGVVRHDLHLIDAAAVYLPAETAAKLQASIKANMSGVVAYMEDDLTLNWLRDVTMENTASAGDMARLSASASKTETEIPAFKAAEEDFSSVKAGTGAVALPWGIVRVKADKVWRRNSGRNVKVAVIDTGIDLDHPDLVGNIIGNYNAVDSTLSADDDHGHGTHVAGTIAGSLKSAAGATGVAPNAKLLAIKVLGANGSGDFGSIVNGIQWAVDQQAAVINMSLGARFNSAAIEKAVAAAKAAGVTVICAAGNDGGPVGYPAANQGAVAIAASDKYDKITSFSNRGAEIQFITPGRDIYSTFMGGGYRVLSGTSMACPHAAGLAALAVYAGAKTPDEVVAKLKEASVSLNLAVTEQGNGLIEANKILKK